MNESDEVATRFRARVNLHLRTGWTMVFSRQNRLDVTLRKRAVGLPRALDHGGPGKPSAAAADRVSFRRIYVDRDNKVQVRLVGGVPEF